MSQKEIAQVRQWGNSGGVLLPKEWVNATVEVTLLQKPLDIKKELLELLAPYMENIAGAYVFGSHARKDAGKESDIDVLIIKADKKKLRLEKKGWEISAVSSQGIKTAIKHAPIFIFSALAEAKPIINKELLEQLRGKYIPKKSDFTEFIRETSLVTRRNELYLEIDKEEKRNYLSKKSIMYSLILRIRGMYLIHCLMQKKVYTKKEWHAWIEKGAGITEQETKQIMQAYESIKRGKTAPPIELQLAERILAFLKKEPLWYDKKKKEA